MEAILINVVDAAALLNIKERTVRDMCAKQILPARRVGRRWLIHKEKLIRWVELQFKK